MSDTPLPEPVYTRKHEPALTIDNALFHPERDAMDRGACQELDADTLVRCDGRRISRREDTRTYKTERQWLLSRDFLTVWVCDKCGHRRVL
jgi:hypothetical protein